MEDRRVGLPTPGLTPDLTRQPKADFVGPKIDLTEMVESLTDEIAGCLRYHESAFPDRRVTRAIFMGGESRHLGLAQHIARTLRLPAQVADPMASVGRTGKEETPGVDFRQQQPGWAMVLGLCMSPTDL
jgi:Tfp pilus assembly PilM family ATPase